MHFICSRRFEELVQTTPKLLDLVNGLFKYALYEATIGEWESLVLALYHINKSGSGIIRIPKDRLIDILCYPFDKVNETKVSIQSYYSQFIIF